jgi:hypothetical protein
MTMMVGCSWVDDAGWVRMVMTDGGVDEVKTVVVAG